jgi:hypothetical protein
MHEVDVLGSTFEQCGMRAQEMHARVAGVPSLRPQVQAPLNRKTERHLPQTEHNLFVQRNELQPLAGLDDQGDTGGQRHLASPVDVEPRLCSQPNLTAHVLISTRRELRMPSKGRIDASERIPDPQPNRSRPGGRGIIDSHMNVVHRRVPTSSRPQPSSGCLETPRPPSERALGRSLLQWGRRPANAARAWRIRHSRARPRRP